VAQRISRRLSALGDPLPGNLALLAGQATAAPLTQAPTTIPRRKVSSRERRLLLSRTWMQSGDRSRFPITCYQPIIDKQCLRLFGHTVARRDRKCPFVCTSKFI